MNGAALPKGSLALAAFLDNLLRDTGLLQEFFPEGVPPGLEFVHGVGCSKCEETGYRGRMAIFEFSVGSSPQLILRCMLLKNRHPAPRTRDPKGRLL